MLVGFEAASLRRWSLRRRWTNVGLVVAPNQETAERRFFESLVGRCASPPPAAGAAASPRAMPEPSPDVIGLFPEPQARP